MTSGSRRLIDGGQAPARGAPRSGRASPRSARRRSAARAAIVERVEGLARGVPVVPGDPGPRQERLDAAGSPAVAGGPRPLAGRGPGQGIVPPLARDGVGAGEGAAVHDDAAARAGAQDDAEDDARPRPGAVTRLGEREAVRVVREAEGAVEEALEILAERAAVEPDAVGVLDEAGGGRERSRHPDADPRRLAALALEPLDQRGDRGQGRRVAVAGRRDAAAAALAPVPVERDGLDLRAAEVDADAHRGRREAGEPTPWPGPGAARGGSRPARRWPRRRSGPRPASLARSRPGTATYSSSSPRSV